MAEDLRKITKIYFDLINKPKTKHNTHNNETSINIRTKDE